MICSPEQLADLAATIADQAQALADGTLTGPRYGHVKNLSRNVETLLAWVADENPSKVS